MAENKKRENTFKPKLEPPTVTEDKVEIQVKDPDAPKKAATPKKTHESADKNEKKSVKSKKENKNTTPDPRIRYGIGFLILCIALFLALSFISYFVSYFNGTYQETGTLLFNKAIQFDVITGKFGSFLAQVLIKESFGIGAFFFVYLLTIIGLRLTIGSKIRMWNIWKWAIMLLAWLPLLFAFIHFIAPNKACEIFGGAVGKFLNANLFNFIGKSGVILTIIFVFLLYLLFEFNLNIDAIRQWRERRADRRAMKLAQKQDAKHNDYYDNQERPTDSDNPTDSTDDEDEDLDFDEEELPPITVIHRPVENTLKTDNLPVQDEVELDPNSPSNTPIDKDKDKPATDTPLEVVNQSQNEKVELVIEKTPEEVTIKDGKEHHTIDTPYDPHYELSDFKFPGLDLLRDFGDKRAEVSNEELEANKNKIVETLANYGIQIDKIKATIGPTVTLYEIVPAAGVRISRIKNLEDDIALSLAALGIRIIAPIPGKGTIGIEVPNKKPETVSMKSVLASEKFQNNKFALPCAIGKTISNETYVFDLAKMPHILMAGATGQGKSVGLNAIIASLLYSKHPSDLKFVMVDPKKVELTLYNRIERHYLAKLPDSEDAIITDVNKVVRTLNSLCIEMDDRYNLLKAAECRNIIEYNEKFKSRRLLPTEGHRYLPYIVLVVDEFADLIMTAGREVESPIARLAQLARAIGIHLIIATQRPSVNIITGSIKANFPARIAFRVISAVDSKTILDQSGANQLIGRGDMLLSTGNDLVRLQCAFIDTPEVEAITSFIGEQRGYSEPFLLPDVPETDSNSGDGDYDDDDVRDSLFEEAARIVVQTQQGSTSMIQRKLKLGYNRAGRIIDQLEAAGIVGPFSGSKSREVKVANEFALEQILKDLELKDQGI
ncbi:MAG: DNA translocase FtsK 4TM domain-containing protein [Bacteroidales bacterium]|nr:DNA translocase FtsK 4TM domain-containing protein [Bacteroidales bacterium]